MQVASATPPLYGPMRSVEEAPTRGDTESLDRTSVPDFEDCCSVFGLRLARFTHEQTLEAVESLIDRGQPAYFITANVNYAMLSSRDPRLQAVNEKAAFLVADGMPLVWAARSRRDSLPERVAGADLFPDLCRRAAARGHRVFLLGAKPGVAAEAARRMQKQHPQLIISGIACPRMSDLTEADELELVAQIRESRTDLLFAALGQPLGELWLAKHCAGLQAVCVQVGASFDFTAGAVKRAPFWLQASGLEWAYRMVGDPRRLAGRYVRNAFFLARNYVRDLARLPGRLKLSTEEGHGGIARTRSSTCDSIKPFGRTS